MRLRQPKSGHRAGHDAMLLAAATPARSGDRVVDFGAGVGAAGLAVARRVAGIDLVLVEIDAALADLARGNAAANAHCRRNHRARCDGPAAAFAAAGLSPDSVDVVLMNPPFNDPARHRASPDKAREIAHVATDSDAGELDSRGAAHSEIRRRADPDLARRWTGRGAGGARSRFGSLAILPVHGDAKAPAIRVLVRAIKGGKAPTANACRPDAQ